MLEWLYVLYCNYNIISVANNTNVGFENYCDTTDQEQGREEKGRKRRGGKGREGLTDIGKKKKEKDRREEKVGEEREEEERAEKSCHACWYSGDNNRV